MSDRDRRIRERAHALWEAEGRPHGKDVLHWDQATAEIDSMDLQVDDAEHDSESAIEVIEEAKIRKSEAQK